MFDEFKLWEADAVAPNNTFATSKHTIQSGDAIKLNYCAPTLTKRQTDVTGTEAIEEVHPDTGKAGSIVELSFLVDRSRTDVPDFGANLIRWHEYINTDPPFHRGFLGLEVSDNPFLNTVPTPSVGYRMIGARQINPEIYKGRQLWNITLQRGGRWL